MSAPAIQEDLRLPISMMCEKALARRAKDAENCIEPCADCAGACDGVDGAGSTMGTHAVAGPGADEKKPKKKKKRSPAEIESALRAHVLSLTHTTHALSIRPTIHPFTPLPITPSAPPHPFLPPSTLAFPILHTPRLVLRPITPADLPGITRIKREPLVQRTQLYGAPRPEHIPEMFLRRYVHARAPRIAPEGEKGWRECVWAIEVREGMEVSVRDADEVGVGRMSRIGDAKGYVGNIALTTRVAPSASLQPKPRKVYTHPTFDQASSAELAGAMFYELHPQLWGQGLMREAFAEVLRFAIEVVGCVSVEADPTTTNPASIALCVSHGMTHTHTTRDNPWRRPQAFHIISRKEWFARHRPGPGGAVRGKWEGVVACRWCFVPVEGVLGDRCRGEDQVEEGMVRCAGCEWGVYCSQGCMAAEWALEGPGGHQATCEGAKRA